MNGEVALELVLYLRGFSLRYALVLRASGFLITPLRSALRTFVKLNHLSKKGMELC